MVLVKVFTSDRQECIPMAKGDSPPREGVEYILQLPPDTLPPGYNAEKDKVPVIPLALQKGSGTSDIYPSRKDLVPVVPYPLQKGPGTSDNPSRKDLVPVIP